MSKAEMKIYRQAMKALKAQEKQALKEAKKIQKAQDKEQKKLQQEAQKQAKQKPQKTERELVEQYANIMISKAKTRGMVPKNFSELNGSTVNKNMWMDSDFYFSVVFQSAKQKYDFLFWLQQKYDYDFGDDGKSRLQIINGLKLAEVMGCTLAKETTRDYPTIDIETKDLILDDEIL